MNKIIIAIDGPSASGKSTVAKIVASKLNYKYIDTGAMYRAVALYSIQNNIDIDDIVNHLDNIHITFDTNNNVYLNDKDVSKDIRSNEVTKLVPLVASNPIIRTKLVQIQQQLGQEKGIVMDGRDIGSVVFPKAELKIYQIASAQARALRRYKENLEKNIESSLEEITKDIEKRDYLDSTREHSPLIKCDDAVELDTSDKNIEEVVQCILDLARERIENNG